MTPPPPPILEASFWDGSERIPTPGVTDVDIDRIDWAEDGGGHFTAVIKLSRIDGALNLARACKGDASLGIEISNEISNGGNPVIEGKVKSIETKVRKVKNLHRGSDGTRKEYSIVVSAVPSGRIEDPPRGGIPGMVYHCEHGPEGERSEKLGDVYRFASGRETRAFICHVCDGVFADADRGRACIEGSGVWKSLMRRPGGLSRVHTLISP